MSLFSKKEKKQPPEGDPTFPPYQGEFPKYESEISEHPKLKPLPLSEDMPPLKRPMAAQQESYYKPLPSTTGVKEAIERPPVKLKPMPQESPQPLKKPPLPSRDPMRMKQPTLPQREYPQEVPMHPSALRESLFEKEYKEEKEAPVVQGKTIFVKVDQYEESMQNLEAIMTQVKNAEDTLTKLEQLRDQEIQQLSIWRQELEDVKAKLKDVDKSLFGR